MNFFKKAPIVLAVLAVLAAGAYYAAGVLLENQLRIAVKDAQEKLARNDVYLNADFESVAWASTHSFTVKNFRATLVPLHAGKFGSDARWDFEAARADAGLGRHSLEIRLEDFHVGVEGKAQFTGSAATAEFPVQWTSMRASADAILAEAKNFAVTGTTTIPYDVAGELQFKVLKDFVKTRIFTEKNGSYTILTMDPKDIERIAADVGDELTYAEISLVSHHPLQAPALLRIKNYAKNTAAAAHVASSIVPEGSYRHILWNYLLTLQFGAEFAKTVSDAHEIGDREGEEANIHLVDFHNNKIGIGYALEGIPESQVLPRLLADKNVVRKD